MRKGGFGEKGRAGFELKDVRRRHAGDFAERFMGEEGLVRGDQDVGEIEQQREFVVVQHLAGEVFKKMPSSSS